MTEIWGLVHMYAYGLTEVVGGFSSKPEAEAALERIKKYFPDLYDEEVPEQATYVVMLPLNPQRVSVRGHVLSVGKEFPNSPNTRSLR